MTSVPASFLCGMYAIVGEGEEGLGGPAHHQLPDVDERVDVLLHVARQPGDELVAQREQLIRRALAWGEGWGWG